MPNEHLKINDKILKLMKKTITMNPIIHLSVVDSIDVYNIKRNTPNIESKREYRICLGNLPLDHSVNKFAVKMRAYDVSYGLHTLAIKEISDKKARNWKEYKAIKPHLQDYKAYEECQILDTKQFINFCIENKITEKQLWYYLLDDTYSKSEEIIYTFYPTIIPIPKHLTKFQRLNSHCLLFTQSKSGKTFTSQKLYPTENYELVTSKTLMGTVTKNGIKKGILDGQGICFIDEVNKLHQTTMGESEHDKVLDYINNYLELGIQRRGVWGEIIEISGVKTCIFSGNVNITKAGEKDFYHLMSCICRFSGDSDKYGRRFSHFIYDNKMNDVIEVQPDEKTINIINSFRKEIICDEQLQKKIISIYTNCTSYIEERDEEHISIIKDYENKVTSHAVKSFLIGMSKTAHKKLRFMSVKIAVANNIFCIIRERQDNFYEKHETEIKETYEKLKYLLIYKQIDNLLQLSLKEDTSKNKIIKYLEEKQININEKISNEEKEKISKELDIPFETIKTTLRRINYNYITTNKGQNEIITEQEKHIDKKEPANNAEKSENVSK